MKQACSKLYGTCGRREIYEIMRNMKNIRNYEIMKYGETTRGTKRYTQKFYRENDVYMEPMAKGTKYEMHYWQHERIQTFFNKYGHLPPMNKSFW